MKKKIAALLCAVAFVFGMPTTAFGISASFVGEEDSDLVTATFDTIKSGSSAIKNVKIDGTAGQVAFAQIEGAGTPSGPTNAIPGTVSAYDIKLFKSDGSLVASAGTKYNSMSFTYQLDDAALANLPAGVSRDNLYFGGRVVSALGGATTNLSPAKLPPAGASGNVSIDGVVGTSTITLWVQVGEHASFGTVAPLPGSDDEDDVDDVPSTIDGLPTIPVMGNSGVVAWGNLVGANIPQNAQISISAGLVTSGAAYDDLRAAMGSGRIFGVFSVDLSVNGREVHDGFGELGLQFPVDYGYEGRTVTVWHRHNDGSITSETATIRHSQVRITARDLSDFGIELGDTETAAPDNGTVSPKTGQSLSAETPMVALCAIIVLGVVSILFARRKMMR